MSQQEYREDWTIHVAQNRQTYYYNKKTKESVWEKPACLLSDKEKQNETDWQEYTTKEGKTFYYNKKLNKSVWKMPEELKIMKEQQEKQKKRGQEIREKEEKRKIEEREEAQKQENQKAFYDYMKERQISIGTKWDEAQKILGKDDKKWNLISKISEKKRLFFEYIRDLENKQRQEKEDKIVNQRDEFFKMLDEQKLTSDAKWHKVVHQFNKDIRFRQIEEKYRDIYFQDYLDDLYKKERNQQKDLQRELTTKMREKILGLPECNQDFTWSQCCKVFKEDEMWKQMHDYYRISCFAELISELEEEEIKRETENKRKQERLYRENFRTFLKTSIINNKIDHKTKYKQFVVENQGNELYLSLLGLSRSTTPHEFFLDEIFALKGYHADLKQELKDSFKLGEFELKETTKFEEFEVRASTKIDAFKKLKNEYKWFFYHLFMNKISGKNKQKDATKKEKKLRKIKKRFFKVMKNFRYDIKPESKYSDFKAEIDKIGAQNQKIQKIKQEMREKLFDEYIQLHLKGGAKVQENDNDDDSESDDDNSQKKRKNSKNLEEDDGPSKKLKKENSMTQVQILEKQNEEMEEEGEITKSNKEKKSKKEKKDKKKKRSRD